VDRPKRDTPKTAAEETAEFVAQKVARMGADITCSTCFHCYQVRLHHNDVVRVGAEHLQRHRTVKRLDHEFSLVCYEGPPQHALMGDGQGGVAAHHVPRIIAKEFFCHRWKTRD
jgi:hypothetical protein